ncbi:DExH-box ATP-dependent RNA helicase DExH15 chloroplastic [Nymphaea colorata]|nr:DExH-box ATP-dependent RNA helicase DExH15 chloroplastic [Nymphaea colorata]XP_049932646.1 DExH-box ATP-dependent RNA helicase DExH15 chloroplastic [Nymphaea colorata]
MNASSRYCHCFVLPPRHRGISFSRPLLLSNGCSFSFLSLTPTKFRAQERVRASFSSEKEAVDLTSNRLSEGEDDDEDEDEAAEEYDELAERTWSYEDGEEEEEDEYGLEEEEEGEEEEEEEEEKGLSSEELLLKSREAKRQRVDRLLSGAREYGEGIVSLGDLISIYDFRIDKFQRLAIEAFLRGLSVVVSAPTSSGKTLIAETAAASTLIRGRRLFYTTPLKALSNQKYREFRDAFGESNVGLLTGDSAINKDAPILIMTTEILRNMLYQSVGMVSAGSRLFLVDVIVLDEVHYLSDISRGTVWEEVVIYCPKEVQLLCLSATIANPEELAGWISQIHGPTELVTSAKRPVPLNWHFSMKSSMLPLLNEKGNGMNRRLSVKYLQQSALDDKSYEEGFRRKNFRKSGKDRIYGHSNTLMGQARLSENDMNALRRSQVPQIRDTLRHLRTRNMLPTIWFVFSRRGCDAAVKYLEDCNLLDEFEMGEVELALKKFKFQFPDAVREISVRGLLQGVAAHHAGCLPLWKSFIEELFQRGLIKVVFATETLAAGINMPARTTVISSLSKRTENRRVLLSSNELLQMAGRAGRRGIDKEGHVVLVQTPFEGAEECCKLLFRGAEPLVSQFTASYGMVLNLLGGSRVTHKSKEDDLKVFRAGRTLEEARQLVEKSFGNYVGSNVMLAAQEEYQKIQEEIELLTFETSAEAIDRKCREQLPEMAYKEIFEMQEELRVQKRIRKQLRRTLEMERMSALKPLLQGSQGGLLPYICLQYKDKETAQHFIPAVYLGKLETFCSIKLPDLDDDGQSLEVETIELTQDLGNTKSSEEAKPCYYVALGSDNSWYLFTERFIKTVYRTGLPDAPLVHGDLSPSCIMRQLLEKHDLVWEKLSSSEFGNLWCMEGSLETWSWSLNVPVLSSLSMDDEVQEISPTYSQALESYTDQRSKVKRLKKKLMNSRGYKEYKRIIDIASVTREKIERLKDRSNRLISRIQQIEPSGWKEFVQVSNVIHEARALDISTHTIFPLGETASAIRGENELWLAMVLRNKILVSLKPLQLAAVCGSLVSDGLKVRPWKDNSYIYEASPVVTNVIKCLDVQRSSLLKLQAKYGVEIPCELDGQFSGMVEAWASGLTWREIMMDCAMDEGDLARLLRRTIDLLAQIPKLPDIDHSLQTNASTAAHVMDRPPISELVG